jgi:hypothetical protein
LNAILPLATYFIWWCRSLALALDQLAVPGDANWNCATKYASLWRHEHRRLALFGCCVLFYRRDRRGDWRTSLITVPVILSFGVDTCVAVATNMVALIFLSLGGTLPFLKGKRPPSYS